MKYLFYLFWFNLGLWLGLALTIIPILLIRAIFKI